jgi:hypothetical protein
MQTQKHPLRGLDSYVRILAILSFISSYFVGIHGAYAERVRTDEEVVLSEAESDRLNKAIPNNVKILFEDEVDRNYFFDFDAREKTAPNPQMLREIKEDRAGYIRMGNFSPTSKRWFYLPHLEIPLSDIEKINVSRHIRTSYRDLIIFEKGGRKYVRYFLHPFRELQNYDQLVSKYPLVYKYVARPTSSPRSLIVIDPADPKDPEWVKVSMHVKVTSLQRRQKLEKLARALAVNDSLEAIPQATKTRLDFDWLPEPIAVKLPGKEEVIIGRDMSNYLKGREGQRLRSTFALFRGIGNEEPPVKTMLDKSGLSHFAFFTKYFITPVVSVFAYLGFEEGIQWGIHTANYMTEQGGNGLPTGKIVLKDFDGSWFDPELRALNGKSFRDLAGHMNEPFAEFMFPSATGRNSGERQHFGEIYNRYLRNAGGFNSLASLIYGYMAQYCREAICADKEALKQKVQDTIDNVMIAQIKQYTGLNFTLADMKAGHLKINGLNRAVNVLRKQLLDKTKRGDAVDSQQDVLKEEFLRLAALKRTWTNVGGDPAKISARFNNKNVLLFWDANAGMIQARGYRANGSEEYSIFGYAMIEDPSKSAESKQFVASVGGARRRATASVADEAPAATCDVKLKPRRKKEASVSWFPIPQRFSFSMGSGLAS